MAEQQSCSLDYVTWDPGEETPSCQHILLFRQLYSTGMRQFLAYLYLVFHFNFVSSFHRSFVAPKRLLSRRQSIAGVEVHKKILFVETGFGCDQHGQNATKAAVRACRNAIEFNSLPAMRELIPGGYDNMKLKVQVAVPNADEVDVNVIKQVFPYGEVTPVIQEGGLCANSEIRLSVLGDKNTDMLIAVAAVYVGY